jgi:carboxyl-terminal processing protease
MSRRDVAVNGDLSEDQARLLAEVMEHVRREYVEPVDEKELMNGAIRGMVSSLDRYSEFLDAEEYRDIRDSTSGRYSGVGLEVSTDDGAIVVIAPIDGTPAFRAGIESGDEIVEIDGVSVRNDGLNEAIDKMRRHAGETQHPPRKLRRPPRLQPGPPENPGRQRAPRNPGAVLRLRAAKPVQRRFRGRAECRY